MNNGTINRKYKDSLFRMIFSEKEELLSLYNAINGSDYSDPGLLEVNTIEDTLYMGMKNDVSFLIGDYLSLYEAQSTWNPNMPLRGFFYFSQLYQGYVAERQLDVYGERQLSLPMPKYVVFFNGTKDIGEVKEVRLSDSFAKQEGDVPALECIATYINVNYGYNQRIMSQCRKLKDYSVLVDCIRKGLSLGKTLKEAVDAAVQDCIAHKVLDDFLRKHWAEVAEVILTGYDYEIHKANVKKMAYQEGHEEGRKEGLKEGRKEGRKEGLKEGLKEGVQVLIQIFREQNMPEQEILAQVMKRFSLEREEAEQYMAQPGSGSKKAE